MKEDLIAHLMHHPKHNSTPDKGTDYNDVINQEGLLFPAIESAAEVVPDYSHTQARDQVIRFDI